MSQQDCQIAPLEELTNFYEQLIQLQESQAKELDISSFNIKEMKEILTQGKPLYKAKWLNFEQSTYESFILGLADFLSRYQPEKSPAVGQVVTVLKGADLEMLLTQVNLGEEEYLQALIKDNELDELLLGFIATNASRPYYMAAAKLVKAVLPEVEWLKNYCPICGNQPDLAKLGNDEGKRYLLCSFCEIEWRFSRMTCPSCLVKDPDKQRYIIVESSRAHQIHLCNSCNSYIKTLDFREATESIEKSPLMIDVETKYLDSIAKQEGY